MVVKFLWNTYPSLISCIKLATTSSGTSTIDFVILFWFLDLFFILSLNILQITSTDRLNFHRRQIIINICIYSSHLTTSYVKGLLFSWILFVTQRHITISICNRINLLRGKCNLKHWWHSLIEIIIFYSVSINNVIIISK